MILTAIVCRWLGSRMYLQYIAFHAGLCKICVHGNFLIYSSPILCWIGNRADAKYNIGPKAFIIGHMTGFYVLWWCVKQEWHKTGPGKLAQYAVEILNENCHLPYVTLSLRCKQYPHAQLFCGLWEFEYQTSPFKQGQPSHVANCAAWIRVGRGRSGRFGVPFNTNLLSPPPFSMPQTPVSLIG